MPCAFQYQHMAINMVDAANFTIWQAALGPESGQADFSTSACSLTTGHAKPLVKSSVAVDGSRVRAWADADGAGDGDRRDGGGAQGAPAAGASEGPGAKAHDGAPALLPVELVTLDMVLARFSQVHLLDMDIQGVEMHVVPAARQLLLGKVHRLHIGTHHITIHQAIRAVLREDNWSVVASGAPCLLHHVMCAGARSRCGCGGEAETCRCGEAPCNN
jgi:FkbM family methyltransferase